MNYEWRRIVSEGLQLYLDRVIKRLDGTDFDDVDNKFSSLLNDLYIVGSGDGGGGLSGIGCRVIKTTSTTVVNGGSVAVVFDTELEDTDGFFVPSSSQVVIPTGFAGRYAVWGNVKWDTHTGGYRAAGIRKNGTDMIAYQRMTKPAALLTIDVGGVSVEMADGDYFELIVENFLSGLTTNALYVAEYSQVLAVAKV